MLPAANRLRTAADLRETTRRGTKVARGSVVVYFATSPEDRAPRVGLVVGKSVGGSVQRHRVSRRIRGAVAPLVAGLPRGSRVVIRALQGAATDPHLSGHVAAGVEGALMGRRQ
jgi:ribonuclease P protein component